MHGVAFARARAAWQAADRLKAAPPSIGPEAIAGPAGRFEAWFMRRHAAAAMIVAAFCATLLIIATQALTSVDRYHTGIGEKRVIALADGSTMRLNTASTAEVSIRSGKRQVHLLSGEALFDVAPDPARPFIVTASSASLRAVGTEFNVRIRPDLVELTTVSGKVSVRDGQGRMGHTVTAGKLAAIRRGVVAESALDRVGLAQRTAWRTSVIELDGTTLAQAIEEFNRYRSAPLVIGDPRIAAIRVGGRFRTSDAAGFVDALERRFAIRAIEGSDSSLVLLAADPSS